MHWRPRGFCPQISQISQIIRGSLPTGGAGRGRRMHGVVDVLPHEGAVRPLPDFPPCLVEEVMDGRAVDGLGEPASERVVLVGGDRPVQGGRQDVPVALVIVAVGRSADPLARLPAHSVIRNAGANERRWVETSRSCVGVPSNHVGSEIASQNKRNASGCRSTNAS